MTVTVLQQINRARFEPHLALLRAEGVWLDGIPADVPLHELGAKRVRGMLPALVRLIQKIRPDVVFSTASGTNVAAIAATRLARTGARVVVSERNILLNGGYRPKIVLQLLLKRIGYRFADHVTALSAGVADDLSSKLGLARERIRVLYNPLIDERLIEHAREPLNHPWLEPGNCTVVSAARLVSWKGHPELLRAFANVRAKLPRARLIVLGEGPERDSLGSLARALGIDAFVEFAGFQTNPFRYFSRCAAFALASHNEGLCNVLVEAMACGAPVISTDCPHGPAEIVSDNIDGYLVPVGDVAALTDRLLRILGDGDLAKRLAKAGTANAWRFSVERVMRNYEAAVAGALA